MDVPRFPHLMLWTQKNADSLRHTRSRMNEDNRSKLQHYIPKILEELGRFQELHSCIMAHMVLQDILGQIGIYGSYPLTVKLLILNPELTKAFDQDSAIIQKSQNVDWKAKGYAMIKTGDDFSTEDVWPRHLVTIVPETFGIKAAILDPTITQANRAELNILLGPLLAGVSDHFLSDKEAQRFTINGCAVIYKAAPNDKSYEQTPLWTDRGKEKYISETIIKKILGGSPIMAIQDSVSIKKIGRNEPCPCGSGRKYKRCHGRN